MAPANPSRNLQRGRCPALLLVVLSLGAAALGGWAGPAWAEPPATPSAPVPSGAALAAAYPASVEEMEKQAREDPLQFLRTALRWSETRVTDYTGRFEKQERIKDELRPTETMQMKFRTQPFSVYLKWIADPSKGQEAIYVEGRYDGKAVVHPSGLLGFLFRKVTLDPLGKLALRHSRRPVTLFGMDHMLRLVLSQCELAQANGDLQLTYAGIRRLNDRPVYAFKRTLPKKDEYQCHVLFIYIDQQFLTCTYTEAYLWDGSLLSRYAYLDLVLNGGLTDEAFDPENRQYAFRLF